MLLSKKKRQEYLKYLGYYKGDIDGIIGPLTKNAYKKLQNDFFVRSKDKDGIYGKNTDILLRCAYNVKKNTKNFKLKEFRCKCKGKYCTTYPSIISDKLLVYLQKIRTKYGVVNITSGLRCDSWNKIQGGSKNSKHIKGNAADFSNSKVCKTLKNRISFINDYIKEKYTNYIYCNGYGRKKNKTYSPNAPGMGRCIHIDINN